LSRDDLSETQEFWLNGLLLGLSGLDEEQDPVARNAKGEAIRLHLISDLQGDDGKNGENVGENLKTVIDPLRQKRLDNKE
jgi:uncharacterized protein YgfB (UPF0149 family)